MANCIVCSKELKFMNTPTFGAGKLSDGGVVCSYCFAKINKINPRIARNLKKETTDSILDILQQKSNEYSQQKIDAVVEKEKPKATNKNAAIGCLVFIIIIAVIAWIISPKGETKLTIEAYRTTQGFVKQHLVAPSTAQFPDYDKSFTQVIGKDSVQVNSYVDSQNGFGAMLRSYYVIQMYKKGDNWYCIYFILNDQRIK